MKKSLALALLAGCAGGASAKLELVNQTGSSSPAALLADGTSLRLKMIAVYLAEDVDPVSFDNVGQTAMIWIHPQCDGDISGCNVSGMELPANGPRVTEYFDLARPTEEVNAELSSSPADVPAGSYRFVRVELCKGLGGQTVADEPTMMWKGAGMPAELPFVSGDCARTSLPFDPPLELAAGDSVAVELGYDLNRAIVVAPAIQAQQCTRSDDGEWRCFRACAEAGSGMRACMDFPDFAPTARVIAP